MVFLFKIVKLRGYPPTYALRVGARRCTSRMHTYCVKMPYCLLFAVVTWFPVEIFSGEWGRGYLQKKDKGVGVFMYPAGTGVDIKQKAA